MNWNFEEYLIRELMAIQNQEGLSDFSFEIETEQAFVKRKDYKPNTIYIVIKYLSDSKTIDAVMQPVQLLVLTEQNSLDVSKLIFDKFAETHNWKVVLNGDEYIKQQWINPVVLSNFNPVLYGYRSVMYMTCNLYIMDGIIDFKKITVTIDTTVVEIEPLSFVLAYSMSTNTQQTTAEEIAHSVKTVSTFAITMTIPMKTNAFVDKIMNILSESTTGNETFTIKLYTSLAESATPAISKSMKLISAEITTAVNQIPGLQIGLLK